MSADRFQQTPSANDSGSWNKYAYTRGDPVNRFDPHGKDDCFDEEGCDPCDDDDNFCIGEGGGGGGGATPPPPPSVLPLTCWFLGGHTSNGGFQNVLVPGGRVDMSFSDPISLAFAAAGGSGDYTFSVSQTVSQIASVTLPNGTTRSTTDKLQNDPVMSSQLTVAGSLATYTDAPGLWKSVIDGLKNFSSASVTKSLVTSVKVSDGNQTVDCPIVSWQASFSITNSKGTNSITGSSSITGVH
jgi:hypothetical protein